ncbi:flagellar brake protein [Chitinimonas sp. BJYL2]|uniref:flagellar brake protein n=1 Tax=Chitinimonas sp. BJYL2 TaxID=2976696 RepID=UPI0022B2C567|nr:flagellar brake protein [Chitinimonas sp. BJYL2]
MAEPENTSPRAAEDTIELIPEGVDVSNYLLHTPVEIGYVLRSLAQKPELISVYFDHGQFSYLSAILASDTKAQKFWFDLSAVDAINRALLRTDHIVFVAAPEGVRVQFVISGSVREDTHDDRPAFVANFPSDLIKLQRREYFRLNTPIGKPLICKMQHPNGKVLELPLHDVSIGGMGLWMSGAVELEQLDVFPGCRVDLGSFGVVEITLEIRSKRQVTRRDGTVQTMVGTRFVDLPRQVENVLQRFIAQLEREQHQLLRQ